MNAKEFKPEFLQIPYQVYADPELSPHDKFVYGVVYWFYSLKDGKCTASNATIASVLNSQERSVQRSLEALEKQGFIQRTWKDEVSKHRAEILPLVRYADLRPNGRRGTTKRTQELRPNGHQIYNTKRENTYNYGNENLKPQKDNLKFLQDRYPDVVAKGAKKA